MTGDRIKRKKKKWGRGGGGGGQETKQNERVKINKETE